MIKNQQVYIQNPASSDPPSKQLTERGQTIADANIVIEDNFGAQATEQNKDEKEKDDNKVINYETFESSSEDEFSQGAFESAAHSFQNKEKAKDQDLDGAQEQKRIERQRRKERKNAEKRKQKAEQDRQKRNNIRKKLRLQSQGLQNFDQYQDDVLNFKDSDRESVISYFEDADQKPAKLFQKNHPILQNLIDTPTRLVNHSNDFLPGKKKVSPEKLAKKGNVLAKNNMKYFKDIEQFSDIERSQMSTSRKQEMEKRDMLFKIVSQNDIEKLQLDIHKQMQANSMDQKPRKVQAGNIRNSMPQTTHQAKKKLVGGG